MRLAILLSLLFAIAPAYAADKTDADRLTVTVRDGEVLFRGADLDVDELRSQLVATGRAGERVYVRIGPGAKSVYIDRVVKAIRAAGFADIAIVGPSGMEKDLDPPV